jgi:ABC-type antimicrobial peptide transport system permease subunit
MYQTFLDETLLLLLSIAHGAMIGFVIGLIGFVFINILIKPNGILDFWTPFIHDKILKMSNDCPIPSWKHRADKVLTNCEKCFSGQLSMWVYLFNFHSFFGLVTCVCIAILAAQYIAKKNNG